MGRVLAVNYARSLPIHLILDPGEAIRQHQPKEPSLGAFIECDVDGRAEALHPGVSRLVCPAPHRLRVPEITAKVFCHPPESIHNRFDDRGPPFAYLGLHCMNAHSIRVRTCSHNEREKKP